MWAGGVTAATGALVAGAGTWTVAGADGGRLGWAGLAEPQPATTTKPPSMPAVAAGTGHSAAITARRLSAADGDGRPGRVGRTAPRLQAAHSRHMGWPSRSLAS